MSAWDLKLSKKSGLFFLAAGLIVYVLFVVPAPALGFRGPDSREAITAVTITNVRDSSFVVSWTTDSLTDGHVDWDTTSPPAANTTTDLVPSTSSHYVQLTGLSPNTTYFFQVRSAGDVDDNGGSYYSVTTGPSIPPATPGRIVFGTVYESDGTTPVPNAIVYIQVRDDDGAGSSGSSQWGSARSDGSGVWFFELNNLRTAALGAYFSFSNATDDLALAAEGGLIGSQASTAFPDVFAVPGAFPAMFEIVFSGLPTETPTATHTAVTPSPTSTGTNTPITPTATDTPGPTATSTSTPVTPTATTTSTPVLPTATSTATPAGPTPTPMWTHYLYLPLVGHEMP